MCGILGYIGDRRHFNSDRFSQALDKLRHRGPDDSGKVMLERSGDLSVALGHRRLSIIDISSNGHQPMISPRTGAIIVYNGEVYNFQEIRKDLEKESYIFQSGTDTEVILAAYDRWGVECVHRLNGMFAFAIFDPERGTVFLARDRVGIKPLYYSCCGGNLTFSSELIPLIKVHPQFAAIDQGALAEFFDFGYFPRQQTPLKNCFKLLPGHHLVFSLRSRDLKFCKYWNVLDYLVAPAWEESEEELLERLRDLLSDAVLKQLVSDVPLGVFLSGGIDSSIVAAIAARTSDTRIKTFSIGFSENRLDEAPFAKEIAKYLGTDHQEFYVSPSGLETVLQQVAEIFDEPFGDTSSVPTYLLSALTRRKVTVALSGDGGDEQFWGYRRYAGSIIYRRFQKMPMPLRQLTLMAMRRHPSPRVQGWVPLLSSRNIGEFYGAQVRWRNPGLISGDSTSSWISVAEDVTARLGNGGWTNIPPGVDFHCYLPDDILTKVDRASMAVSLETRVPLLDHRLVEFSSRLPHQFKYRKGTTKYLFKRLLGEVVPRPLWDRPKKGFAIPLAEWFRGPLRPWVLDELTSDWNWTFNTLDQSRVSRMIQDHMSGYWDHSSVIWSFLVLKSWGRRAKIL